MSRLRVPAALGVALVATATSVSIATGGCERHTDPIDAAPVTHGLDASPGDGTSGDGELDDAGTDDAVAVDSSVPPDI